MNQLITKISTNMMLSSKVICRHLSVCEVTVELRKLSEDSTKSIRSKVYKTILESINAPVSKTLKLFPITGKKDVKLEYRLDIKVRS